MNNIKKNIKTEFELTTLTPHGTMRLLTREEILNISTNIK